MKMKVDQFISQHNHINYCEIIILDDGCIVKAIPSHTETLIRLWCDKNKKTRDCLEKCMEYVNDIPIVFLCNELKCIAVWHDSIIYPEDGINRLQLDTLQQLMESKIICEFSVPNII